MKSAALSTKHVNIKCIFSEVLPTANRLGCVGYRLQKYSLFFLNFVIMLGGGGGYLIVVDRGFSRNIEVSFWDKTGNQIELKFSIEFRQIMPLFQEH